MDPMLEEWIWSRNYMRYAMLAMSTLWFSDFVHTFPDEVELMWGADLSLVKVLFFLSRYIPVDMLGAILHMALEDYGMKSCRIYLIGSTTLYIASIAIAEAIMYIRLYALSGRSRNFRIGLSVLYSGIYFALTPLALYKWLGSSYYKPWPTAGTKAFGEPRCDRVVMDIKFPSAWWGTVFVSELVIVSITLWMMWKTHRSSKSPLLTIFFRDGIVYFVAFTASSFLLIGMIQTWELSISRLQMLTSISRTIHSILAYRTILHLRRQVAHGNGVVHSHLTPGGPESMGNEEELADMRFASVGQISARSIKSDRG